MNIYFWGMCISFVVYILIGAAVSKKVKNADDYYVAGRKEPDFFKCPEDAGGKHRCCWSPDQWLLPMPAQACLWVTPANAMTEHLRR